MEQETAILEKEFNDYIQSISVGRAEKHRNLTVFPLYSGKAYEKGYALLEEAVWTGMFLVSEVCESAEH